MLIVSPSAEIIGVGPQASEKEALQLIELAGRVCYKSEEKIGPKTSGEFLRKIVANGHTSVMEHATMCMPCDDAWFNTVYEMATRVGKPSLSQYAPGSKIGIGGNSGLGRKHEEFLVWANYRAIYNNRMRVPELLPGVLKDGYIPNDWRTPIGAEDLVNWALIDPAMMAVLPRYMSFTFRVVCDRGVSHEFVRHRVMSFSQESTRFCNYNGSDIKFIRPSSIEEGTPEDGIWQKAMLGCEVAYTEMSSAGSSPQVARSVLPNSLKTELVVTATLEQWNHFLYLRLAKGAHPDMRVVAKMIHSKVEQRLNEFDTGLVDLLVKSE